MPEEEIAPRTPPGNLRAEQALLGALLSNNKAYDHVSEFLRPHHFWHDAHQHIFKAVEERLHKNQLADPVTLIPHLTQQ